MKRGLDVQRYVGRLLGVGALVMVLFVLSLGVGGSLFRGQRSPGAALEDDQIPAAHDLPKIRLDHADVGLMNPVVWALGGAGAVFGGLVVGAVVLAARQRPAAPDLP
jgi:hypothetical protein